MLKFEIIHRNINMFAAMLNDSFSSRSVIDRGLLVQMTEREKLQFLQCVSDANLQKHAMSFEKNVLQKSQT